MLEDVSAFSSFSVDDINEAIEFYGEKLGISIGEENTCRIRWYLFTHRINIDEAPQAYEIFRNKDDGCIKVVMKPNDQVSKPLEI